MYGRAIRYCPYRYGNAALAMGRRRLSDNPIKGNIMKLKTPPPTLKDIVDSIAAARGVTLYRESSR
jgi:hypothetical protein